MEKTDTKRRSLMFALGLGGAGAAMAMLAGKTAAATEAETAVPETAAPHPGKGYRLSQHVQTYYRKARI